MEKKEHKSIVAVLLVVVSAILIMICIAYKFIEWFLKAIPFVALGFFGYKK